MQKLAGIALAETSMRYNLQTYPQCHGAQPPDKSGWIAREQEINEVSANIYSDLNRHHTKQISAKEIPHKETL